MNRQYLSITDSINLVSIQTDRFKTGILTFTFAMPLTPKATALHILLAGIMRRGCQKYPSVSAINRRLDELYATELEIRSSKLGKNLLFTMTAEILDDRYIPSQSDILNEVVEVISDLLRNPLLKNGCFDDRIVQQEIRTAIDNLNAEINNTRSYASLRCNELMYRHDPDYPTINTLKEIFSNINGSVLFEHYQTLLYSSPLDVFYVGSASPEGLACILHRHFSTLFDNRRRYVPISVKATAAQPFLMEKEQMAVAQGKLSMGFRTGICAVETENYYPALLFNELFGGSAASKLFLNVREKMSLCYYCSSSYSIYTGDIKVSSGIEVPNRERVYQAVLDQLSEIQNANISQTEWEAAKKSLENCYRQIYDSPVDLQSFYGARHFFGLEESIEECRARIANVTKEEVVELAKKTNCDTVFFVEGTLPQESIASEEEEAEE